MINEEDVISIYKALLDRKPESQETIQAYMTKYKNIESMARVIKNSKEFKHKYMLENMPEKVVVYIHIPKTAGTYLRTAWLLNNYNKYFWSDRHLTYPKIKDLQQDYIEASSYEMIGGHQVIDSFLKMKTIQPRVFLNVLREPVSRIISFYNHVKNVDTNHIFNKSAAENTLFELLEQRGAFYRTVMNEQIRYLIASEELLEKFSDRDFLIIGRQDNTEGFIEAVNEILGLSKGIAEGSSNAGGVGYKKEIESQSDFPEALEILKEMTQQESELYNSIENVTVMGKNEYREFVQKFTDKER